MIDLTPALKRVAEARRFVSRVNGEDDKDHTEKLSEMELRTKVIKIRAGIEAVANTPLSERTSPFIPLTSEERAVMRWQIAPYIENGQVFLPNNKSEIQTILDTLFIDGVCGETIVAGQIFRDTAIKLYERMAQQLFQVADCEATDIICVSPWRAGLAGARGLWQAGVHSFAHLGCSRNHDTLKTAVYYANWPQNMPVNPTVAITDKMLASGETFITVIKWILEQGISQDKILIHAAVAVPEGIDKILHQFPEVKLFTASIQSGLNRLGYIEGLALGDAGDKIWNYDMNLQIGTELFVEPGIITESELQFILDRTQVKQAAHS